MSNTIQSPVTDRLQVHVQPAAGVTSEAIEVAAREWSGGWLCHLGPWAQMCTDVFGAHDVSIAVTEEPSRALAGWWPLALKQSRGFRFLESAAFGGYGGPLIADTIEPAWQDRVRFLMMRQLEELVRAHHVDRIRVLPWPRAEESAAAPSWPWQQASFRAEPYEAYLLDLSQPLATLRQRCAQNVRHAIGQAQRYGVQVVREESPEALEAFYALFVDTYRRTGADLIPKEYFVRLWQMWGGERQALHLFVARQDHQPLAAALVAAWKDWAVYWSNGSNEAGLQLRANNLLQWEIICWLKSQGIRWYEVGRNEPGVQSTKQRGIDFFKTRFGVERRPAVAWVRDVRPVRCRTYDLVRAGVGWIRRA